MEPGDPRFLARYSQGSEHQIRLQGQQLTLQFRPDLSGLVAVQGHDQLQAGVLLGQALHQGVHDFW